MSEKKQSAGAIWKKTINTKYGQMDVLSITIEGKRYTAWPNKSKKESKHPDYNVQEDTYVPNRDLTQAAKSHTEKVSGDLPF